MFVPFLILAIVGATLASPNDAEIKTLKLGFSSYQGIWEDLYKKFKDLISQEKAKLEELEKLLHEAEQEAIVALEKLKKELDAQLEEAKEMSEEIIEQLKKDYESAKKLIKEKFDELVQQIKDIIKNHGKHSL